MTPEEFYAAFQSLNPTYQEELIQYLKLLADMQKSEEMTSQIQLNHFIDNQKNKDVN